ncbi:phosphodiester glycosidase family protein [uncultured Litoreibacter sp.]|uniref:phosphodiester glycosidase family protein n=1 Tax=uncultured Litoreibacter sp. TaxID=1392394 RepID=UPI002620809B|nr:phosphodiester glycosidase family protein [uncultured Litoreibacter sp.]
MKPSLLTFLLAWAFSTALHADTCRQVDHLGDQYTICTTTDPTRIVLELLDEDGTVIGDFEALDRLLAAKGETLSFAMNGGMYHDDRRAVGLFINEQGQQQSLMTREGPGNFGLLPNGLFCVTGNTAYIFESRAFERDPTDCRIATQSGPMLVIDGQLHPKFLPDSPSKKWRNGVGVDAAGAVHFAISDNAVRFHDFATLFRDVLNAPNALFLDGTISRMHAPSLGRSDRGARMGPILGVVTRD